MDPISQAALGALAPQALLRAPTATKRHLLRVGCIGALAGMAPDLDVLIRSSSDPLLQLEFHRQFTHSLVFIPIGAALCASVFWLFLRQHMRFLSIWLVACLGYGTHGLLDACTTYGTLLLWPFSNTRVAWNTISVIDPLFTLPTLACVVMAGIKQSRLSALLGVAWVAAYLTLGTSQETRAINQGAALANHRGHEPTNISAKPSFGNLLLWKTVYEYDGQFWVDAVRVGIVPTTIEGDHVEKLVAVKQLPWLDPVSQQARDIERFRWFSNDHLALDKNDPLLIVDIRYSHLPNEINGLWGIRLDPRAAVNEHVEWVTRRSADTAHFERLWALLKGDTMNRSGEQPFSGSNIQ